MRVNRIQVPSLEVYADKHLAVTAHSTGFPGYLHSFLERFGSLILLLMTQLLILYAYLELSVLCISLINDCGTCTPLGILLSRHIAR